MPALTGDAALSVDEDGRIVGWTVAAQKLFGFRRDEALGRTCYQVARCCDPRSQAPRAWPCAAIESLRTGLPTPASQVLVRDRAGRALGVTESALLLSTGAERRALLSFVPIPSGVVDPAPWAGGPLAGGPEVVHHAPPDLAAMLDRLLAATEADAAELFLAAPVGTQLVLASHRGLAPRAFREITGFEPGSGFPGLVALTGEPLFSLDLPHDDRYLRAAVKRRGFRSYLCTPIASEAGFLGSLHIASLGRDCDPASRLPLLAGVADGLGRALENARFRVAQPIAGHLRDLSADAGANLRALADLVLGTLMGSTAADGGAILLLGDESRALERIAERGPPSGRRGPAPCHPATCPALLRRAPFFHAEPTRTEPTGCGALSRDLATALCLPLEAGGTRLGVAALGWEGSDSLPTRRLSLLHGVIRAGAAALHNARLALRWETAVLRRAPPPPVAGAALDSAADSTGGDAGGEGAGGVEAEPPMLDFRCLGRFAIQRAGREVPAEAFGRRQPLTLLKILLTHYGRPLSWDLIAELLWPEEVPPNARDLVEVIIHRLRRGLEPESPAGQPSRFVRRSGDSYFFDPDSPHRLDSREFSEAAARGVRLEAEARRGEAREAYLEAGALYAGDFLEEEPYSDWCAAERERLQQRFLEVVRRLARLSLAGDDPDVAVAWYRRALRVDETLEELHRALMEALWRSGRKDEALRQYHSCRTILRRELDVAPSPETTALHQRIAEG